MGRRKAVFDKGGVKQHNFTRAAPNELLTRQQTAAHQTNADKIDIRVCYYDPCTYSSTMRDSN